MHDATQPSFPALIIADSLYRALQDAGLGTTERAVFLTMMYYTYPGDGICIASAAQMASDLGISHRRVRAARKVLVEAGIYAAEQRRGQPTAYRFRGRPIPIANTAEFIAARVPSRRVVN